MARRPETSKALVPRSVRLATVSAQISEADLLNAVIECARTLGWLTYHARVARNSRGWCTPTQGDVGFCDLVLARGGCLIFAELKSRNGRLRPEQRTWLGDLSSHQGWRSDDGTAVRRTFSDGGWMAVVVWRPDDWLSGRIAKFLEGGEDECC